MLTAVLGNDLEKSMWLKSASMLSLSRWRCSMRILNFSDDDDDDQLRNTVNNDDVGAVVVVFFFFLSLQKYSKGRIEEANWLQSTQ